MIKNIINLKDKNKKFYLSFIGLTIIFVLLIKLLTMVASTSDIPTLWINDKEFSYYRRYPLEIINGEPYVPRMIFEYINNVEIGGDENRFYILYSINNAWISFDAVSHNAQTRFINDITQFRDTIDFYSETYIIHGVRYVNARIVTDNLGIGLDYDPQIGVLRIKDRSARRTLESLISSHIVEATTPTPTTLPITAPPTPATPPPTPAPPPTESETGPTAEPTTAENTREIVNYFMFHSNSSVKSYAEPQETEVIQTANERNEREDLDYLLDILNRENIQSIFFLTEREILNNPEILRKVYAMGHEVGIKLEKTEDRINPSFDELLTELEKINALIYTVTKHKTRFYILDENMYEIANNPESEEWQSQLIESLKKEGYYQFKETIKISNFQVEQNIGISELYENENILGEIILKEMIEFLKREEINVIKFELETAAENDLALVINAVRNKFYITVAKINLPFFLGSR